MTNDTLDRIEYAAQKAFPFQKSHRLTFIEGALSPESGDYWIGKAVEMLRSEEALKFTVECATGEEPFIPPGVDWADWLEDLLRKEES
jgi:hypothetical protein